MNPTTTLLVAISLLSACGGKQELATDTPASSRGIPGVSVLRIPREGGVARLYRVPALDSAPWKPADPLPAVDRPIGSDPEQGLVFVLDRKSNVVALDLDTRRVRTYLENILDQLEDEEQISFMEEALDNLAFTEDLERFDLLSFDPEGDLTEIEEDDE